ncbi:hypothetical protein HLB44_34735 [Aquincola sp. S2]|uniref:Serine aminopeptidase S33 domain-containing protein n=1 Tax=Pseudaquabacterium terrae TaxID=2732868 RepID=A0ABX2ETW1_9BURK|nr:hypothetical protein [Aquabacterium terrae]NRF72154.1 hypothetical protein [Aquabacterium terrae]
MLPPNASPDLAALEAAFETPAERALGAANDTGFAAHRGPEPAPFRLTTADGVHLAARWYEPATPVRAVALISAATGVPQRYYRHFAAWLTSRGYAVLSYDYRGIGESRRGALRADPSRMRDWALLDMPAALAEVERRRAAGVALGRPEQPRPPRGADDAQRRPGGTDLLPLLLIGHSFGGNAIGLVDGVERADALLGIAAQSGEWRLWPGYHRLFTHLFFHALLPAAAHLFGRVPGWVMGGSGAGLPKGVALDWARWGRRRGYLFDDPALAAHIEGYRSFAGTAHLWNITDDWTYGPPAAVNALAERFTRARVQRPTLDARALGAGPIGHFGAFRAALGARIWPQWLERIEAATPALRRAGLASA